eukprot:CAMPEP_0178652020 /NCGR_PEP_ID=MMETSP0698-20121128/22416_1 /TAXON_ID=265572 /ORGANISM="Extubocellulus spinifer, Strain CCMP396" /LENGTH=183 /DNA_ID=CAMNT_0020293677 /DNA_START=348 /DNA_END=899 /DNA_ORIENTATION=+
MVGVVVLGVGAEDVVSTSAEAETLSEDRGSSSYLSSSSSLPSSSVLLLLLLLSIPPSIARLKDEGAGEGGGCSTGNEGGPGAVDLGTGGGGRATKSSPSESELELELELESSRPNRRIRLNNFRGLKLFRGDRKGGAMMIALQGSEKRKRKLQGSKNEKGKGAHAGSLPRQEMSGDLRPKNGG